SWSQLSPSGAVSTSRVSCGEIQAGRVAVGGLRSIECARPEAEEGLARRRMRLDLGSGNARGAAVAEGGEFGQQVCQTISRLVAQPANRLRNIEPGWLQGRIKPVRERQIVIFGIVFPEGRARPIGVPMIEIGAGVFVGAVEG